MALQQDEKPSVNGVPVSPTDSETTAVPSGYDVEAGESKEAKRWYSSLWSWNSKTSDSEILEAYQTKTRILDKCPEGYSQVAAFQSSDPKFMQYRSFGYLHARLLSALQCEIEVLERKLDRLDAWDKSESGDRDKLCNKQLDDQEKTPDQIEGDFEAYFRKTRPQILAELKQKLMEYDEVLLKSKEVMSLQRPSGKDYDSVRFWFYDQKPIIDEEAEFILRKEDIVTLWSGRECAGFDGLVERCLSKIDIFLVKRFKCQLVGTLFRTPELEIKTQDKRLHYYDPRKVDKLVNCIITLVIFILMVLPVVAMYELSGMGESASAFEAISVLIISTLLFGLAMSSLTKATRQELFAASAAYCAVLVVFIGDFSTQAVSVVNSIVN